MGYLFDNCTISVFTEELLHACEPFSDIVKQWYRSDEIKAGCRMLIVDALNKPEVLAFYRKNGFEALFTSEQQEDFYVNPPKDEEQRLMRLANPTKLETRLMFTDLLKD